MRVPVYNVFLERQEDEEVASSDSDVVSYTLVVCRESGSWGETRESLKLVGCSYTELFLDIAKLAAQKEVKARVGPLAKYIFITKVRTGV
jgi:hypothetical protein